jgi:hypothetical protein
MNSRSVQPGLSYVCVLAVSVVLAILATIVATPVVVHAGTYTYDGPATTSVEVPFVEAFSVAPTPLTWAWERSASPSASARGTTTIPLALGNATNGADDVVGSHGSMPRPRPAGMESHHGVNSVWAEANIPGYRAADAPAVLMPSAGHNATRGVFNRWRSEIAGRQGVPIRDIDWAAVSPGSAWSLAEEQFAAAGTAASTIDDYFAQWNRYLDGLRGGM